MFWNIIIGIASFLLNLVLMPKPQNAKPASLSDFNIPVAEEGVEIPIVFGTVYIRSPNCVWYGDFKAQDIKGARRYGFFGPRQVIGHKYYLGMHMVLCHGVHDLVRQIWAGEKQIYPKAPSVAPFVGNGTIYIDQEEIFGGKDREGGILGNTEIWGGAPSQGVISYLADKMGAGADTPAFRGVVSYVWDQLYIGTNSYIKPWEFVLQRIHLTSRGIEQWYDEKAAVPDVHTSATTAPGVQLTPSGPNFMNTWGHLPTGGSGASYVNGSGALQMWTLPAGTVISRTLTTGVGQYGYATPHMMTDDGYVIIRIYGDIWASGISAISVLNAETGGTVYTEYLRPMWITGLDLNFGLQGTQYGNDIIIKLGPYVYPSMYWIHMQRTGGPGSWQIVGSAVPDSDTITYGTNFGGYHMTMGPDYVYCLIGQVTSVLKASWPGMGSTIVDMAAIGMPAGWWMSHHAYHPGTGTYVVFAANPSPPFQSGIFVFDADLTTLIRYDYTSYGTIAGAGSGPEMIADSNSVWAWRLNTNDVLQINVNDLTITRTILNANMGYVNKSQPITWAAFNPAVSGWVVGGHAYNINFWPFTPDDPWDMNPAHIIKECLTDKTWGMGYSDADIDEGSFIYAANVLWDECFGISIQWTKEERIEEFITMILSHIDAYLYLRRDTGKFYLKLVRSDYNILDLPIYTEDDVVVFDEISHRQPAEAVNSVIVKYVDRRNRGRDASVSHDNIAQIQQLGERISTTQYYPGISRGALASQVAGRNQKTLGIGMISGRIQGNRDFDELYPGDVFRVVSNRHNLDGEVVRVASMRFGDGRSNRVSVQFVQDIFNLGAADLIDTTQGDWENPLNPPAAVVPRIVWEMPYRELREMVGPSDTTTILTGNPLAGMLQMAGGRPTPDSIEADVYVDTVFEETMPFAPAGVLDLDIGILDDTVFLTDLVDETNFEVGKLVVIVNSSIDWEDAEIVRIESVGATYLQISRGCVDTVPRAHDTGDWLIGYDDFSISDFDARTKYDVPSTQLLTRTGLGILSIGLAPADVTILSARAIRPLRPAGVTIEGESEGPVDATGLGTITVDWFERNRLTDVDPIALAWTDPTVAAEAGQTTVIEVLDPLGLSVLTTHSGLTGTTYNVPVGSFSGNSSGYIRVGSERDGYREWQAYTVEVLVSVEPLVMTSIDLTMDGDALAMGA